MAKLNKGYLSFFAYVKNQHEQINGKSKQYSHQNNIKTYFFDYLIEGLKDLGNIQENEQKSTASASKPDIKKQFFTVLVEKLQHFENVNKISLSSREKDKTDFLTYLTGPLQHFVDIGKDVADTVKPYKGSYQVWRDTLQPIYGLSNLLKGLLLVVAAPINLIVQIFVMSVNTWLSEKLSFKELPTKIAKATLFTFSAMLDGILHGLRGVTQIAATPLAWLKISIRAVITAVHGGFQAIEEDDSYKELNNQIIANKLKRLEQQELKMNKGIALGRSKTLFSNPAPKNPNPETDSAQIASIGQ